MPDADRYQLLNEYDVENIRHTCSYLGMTYADQLLTVEISSASARSGQDQGGQAPAGASRRVAALT